MPRPQPDGRSSIVNEKYPTGKLYCLNAYLTDSPGQSAIRPGTIKQVRVIEGVPEPVDADSVRSPVAGRRLLGVVPVEADGSFQVELPADVPVQLQTLDEYGMALKSCGWIWAKNREPRGCIGCHEDPELTPENRFVLAVRKPAVVLTQPPDQRRMVSFQRDVAPIVATKCMSCHDGTSRQLDLRTNRQGYTSRAYQSLLAGGEPLSASDKAVMGKYVHPYTARTSPLVWRLFGRNTSRSWDDTYNPDQTIPSCPPPGAKSLTAEERRTFIEWIDLGARWNVQDMQDREAK